MILTGLEKKKKRKRKDKKGAQQVKTRGDLMVEADLTKRLQSLDPLQVQVWIPNIKRTLRELVIQVHTRTCMPMCVCARADAEAFPNIHDTRRMLCPAFVACRFWGGASAGCNGTSVYGLRGARALFADLRRLSGLFLLLAVVVGASYEVSLCAGAGHGERRAVEGYSVPDPCQVPGEVHGRSALFQTGPCLEGADAGRCGKFSR